MIAATLVDVMGDDLTVIKAAKVSFDNDEDVQPEGYDHVDLPCVSRDQAILTEKQKRLIGYLARGMDTKEFAELCELAKTDPETALWKFRRTPTHLAPFGHCAMSFIVEAPVFVARQLVKHEYLRMSEVSRRYVKGDPVYWKPAQWHGIADNVKQGAGDVLDADGQEDAGFDWHEVIGTSDQFYNILLRYVAPEEARIVLPLCHMTRWRWTGSLDAFSNMCNLRLDDHAQGATREVAQMISKQARMAFPASWQALVGDR